VCNLVGEPRISLKRLLEALMVSKSSLGARFLPRNENLGRHPPLRAKAGHEKQGHPKLGKGWESQRAIFQVFMAEQLNTRERGVKWGLFHYRITADVLAQKCKACIADDHSNG
jgi:hypothetical protein